MRDTDFVDSRGKALQENDEVMFLEDGMRGVIKTNDGKIWYIYWNDSNRDLLLQYWRRVLKVNG